MQDVVINGIAYEVPKPIAEYIEQQNQLIMKVAQYRRLSCENWGKRDSQRKQIIKRLLQNIDKQLFDNKQGDLFKN